MIRSLIGRVLWAGVLFIAVTLVTYIIFFVITVDPARLVVGQRGSPQDIERARHFLGLDRPVPVPRRWSSSSSVFRRTRSGSG